MYTICIYIFLFRVYKEIVEKRNRSGSSLKKQLTRFAATTRKAVDARAAIGSDAAAAVQTGLRTNACE